MGSWRRHQAVLVPADEVFPVRGLQRGDDEHLIFRVAELEQSALLALFLTRARNIDGFHRTRIQARIEHASGECPRRGIKILYLLWVVAGLFEV